MTALRSDGSTDEAAPRVLARRDGVLLAYKPAGWPTEPVPDRSRSLVAALSDELGGVPVHAATRLDVGVSGVVVCSVGSAAARQLEDHRGAREIHRTYVAIAVGCVSDEGSWDWPLSRKRARSGRITIDPPDREARWACTRFAAVAWTPKTAGPAHSLLQLWPDTGRQHQLRAHAAHAGAPLLGDRRYGGSTSVVAADGSAHSVDRIALHALRVTIADVVSAEAPIPCYLQELWTVLGGAAKDWARLAGPTRVD